VLRRKVCGRVEFTNAIVCSLSSGFRISRAMNHSGRLDD
jgi:hypothetical protein